MPELTALQIEKLIREKCPSFTSQGRKWFVVERDIVVSDDRVAQYARARLATPAPADPLAPKPSDLVAATVNGMPMRWELGTTLTWAVARETFRNAEEADRAEQFTTQATADWNEAAASGSVDIRFAPAGDSPAVFDIVFEDFANPNLFAVAFFPNDPVSSRIVRLGPAMFAAGSVFDPVGVLRHELGHVLGFRHEHIRTNAPLNTEPLVIGDLGALNLTVADFKSVMHYPMGPGFGTNDFRLTDLDKAGLKVLYTMTGAQVEEFAP